MIDMTNKLSVLQMNKYCQNKWTHFNGKCYYFSPSKVYSEIKVENFLADFFASRKQPPGLLQETNANC